MPMCETQCGLSTLPANTRSWPNVVPILAHRRSNQHWFSASCWLIAVRLVVLTAGGDYKPTPIQCLLNVGPASPVLASIHSALVGISCWRERVHIQQGALLQTAIWKYLLISQVYILPSFGRAVPGTAADSETEESAYFTSVLIPEGLWQAKESAVTPVERKYILDLQVSTYSFLATLLHAGQRDRNEWHAQTALIGQR